MAVSDVDVVVVGAGLSGLQTAYLLQQLGYQCHVLEATSRVGGKTKTVDSKSHGPGVNDVGAAWINDTTQSEMYKLFKRYNIEGEVQLVSGKSVYEIGEGTFVALPYGERPLDEESQKALLSLITHLNELVKESNLEDPADGPNAKALDSCTFQKYCADRCKNEVALAFASSFTRALLGVEADEVSALYMINYFKSGTGIANLASDGKDGGQYLRARQGMQSISEGLASELKPDTLHLNAAVTSISQNSPKTCTVSAIDGQVFKCRKVVISVPSPLLRHITFEPSLPPARQALSDSTVLGYYSKTVYVFDKPWWREAGLCGAFQSSSGPASFSRDTSIPADDQWSISCFLVGDPGRNWSKVSKKLRQEKMWEQFSNCFHDFVNNIPAPVNVIEQEWTKEQWFEGAPCPVMGPGVMTSSGAALRSPFNNVHFVGTETSDVWKGYMEGAVRSGHRGAEEVIQSLKALPTRGAHL